jgi:hypothetical protein
MQASHAFFNKKRLIANEMMDNEPVDVPNVRPTDRTCALYTPAMAASVQIVASAVRTIDRISQNEQRPDFFLDDLNIVRKGKEE